MISSSSAGAKRKRKSEGARGKIADRGSDDDTAASGSDIPHASSGQHQGHSAGVVDLKKRTKTVRVPSFTRPVNLAD